MITSDEQYIGTSRQKLIMLFDAAAECAGHHQLFDDSSPDAVEALRAWADLRELKVTERPVDSAHYDRIVSVELGGMRAIDVFCARAK